MTETTRVLIAEDEPLAAEALAAWVLAMPQLALVAACTDGESALAQIRALQPDLVLMDINMPGLTGLQVLRSIVAEGLRPAVIFTTAYDEHAIKAFELHAVDYLLKPFSRARFDDALAPARTPHAPALDALVARRTAPLERILIRDREQVHVIAIDHVECIEAQGDYLAIHAEGKCHLKPQRISEIEEQLDGNRFLRVHRSFIISLAHLQAIERPGPDRHAARLRSGKRVPISRSGYEKLRELV